jgi:hypothetical protein
MIIGAGVIFAIAGIILLADRIDKRRKQWEDEIEWRRRG